MTLCVDVGNNEIGERKREKKKKETWKEIFDNFVIKENPKSS
mgnify:CR=1 FL=1